MKTIAILFCLLLPALLFSATFRVAKDGIALYNEVQPAINAASAGDTIFVAASTASYAGFNVDRRLVIYGAGTDTIPGQGTIIAGVVSIYGTADSSEVYGLWIRYSTGSTLDSLRALLVIRSGAVSIRAERCFFDNSFTATNAASGAWVGHSASAVFADCGFWLNYAATHWKAGIEMTSSTPGCRADVYNCVFEFTTAYNNHRGIASGNNQNLLTVRHCIFNSGSGIDGSAVGSVENSAHVYSGLVLLSSTSGITANYSAQVTSPAPVGTGNFVLTGTPFVNFVNTNPRRSDYHLSANSVLRNTGNPIAPTDTDGSRADIGIFGGQTPYVEFGLPDFPIVLELEVPASVPQNGVLHVGSRGRVGPGN